CLTTELNDNANQLAVALLSFQNFDHVFCSQWLEIEAIRCVVICGNCFRVTVDHDGFKASFLQCEGGVAAAIVKFDALTDTVWTTTKDNNLFAIGNLRFGACRASKWHFVG